MTVAMAAAVFLLTITLVIWQPRGLGIGYSAAGGALLALALGVVSWSDVWTVTTIVWNATFAFIAIILISLLLDEIGFFEWSALHMARMARGNGLRLFLFVILLGAAVSALFTNDGGVVILTPIVLAMVRALRFDNRMILPFIMASGFIADTTSLPLVVSNLVNIVSADYFGIGFAEYASRMLVPNLFALAASMLMLYLVFRRDLPIRYEADSLKAPSEAVTDWRLFKLSWWILGGLLIAYFASEAFAIPVSAAAGFFAVILLIAAKASRKIDTTRIVRDAPWSIVVFSIGMYVVVYGLRNAGLTDMLSAGIRFLAEQGMLAATIGMGFLAAALSSVMNNLPTVMIGAIAIQDAGMEGSVQEALVYANVIGSDLGPKMTPIGSLATLLWLHMLSRKGLRITWGYYFRVGVVLTIPVLLVTLLGLYLWLKLIL